MVLAGTAAAQGVQTASLSGTVKDAGDLVLPGVTVSVTSPELQGARTTVTDAKGVYVLRGLPPGTYTVTFELSGMKTVTQTAVLEVGPQAEVNATLPLAGVQETVNVTAESIASAIVSPTAGENFKNTEITALPTGRTVAQIAALNVVDFGLTCQVPVFRSLRPWVKLDVFNIFNNDKLITWNAVVRATTPARVTRSACRPATARGRSSGRGVERQLPRGSRVADGSRIPVPGRAEGSGPDRRGATSVAPLLHGLTES